MRTHRFMKWTATVLASAFLLAGCSSGQAANEAVDASKLTLDQIVEKAKQEGQVNSVGMPDTWANWVQTWNDLGTKYSLKHTDTDMSSAEELAKFESEKDDATADIGDVGIAFGPLAKQKGLTLPYKTSYWNDIPDWAKDDEGHWLLGYTGTLSIISDKNKVANPPKSWADIKNGTFKVAVGDVMKANQAQFAVLAAAYAFGGDEKNIQPGIDFFAELAKQGRLASNDAGLANLEKGEVEVGFLWDFNALGYRDKIDKNRFEVVIPREASATSGYATVINKYSKHPHAAMLAREYILSDEGQSNLARGYARPIRSNAKLAVDAKAMLLPDEMYKNAQPVKDLKAWEETTKQLPQLWQEQVLIHVK
ncbi:MULTISPECIES: ABC transporter substrate-binding protein [unclassified Paenibacillus]|uniref:ABC transporter substrate-binding protein n=1 Tax=unclassified Paenibacillus TaxID=185978 RepID=UPI000490F414|nr:MULTISPECIES: ABC transporter substrate-binding protein [unclassified Paenibacillus]SDE48436.1 putative spermidine/putrescine transport system substrate-binding protein [Paenibacillus sp. cl6col]